MKNKVSIRFYEELNYFLDKKYRKKRFETSFPNTATVKALIEDLGVPHTEVDLILINGNSVSLSCKLHNGDSISVYPVFETFDISEVTRVRKKPLRAVKFLADVHLGKLTTYLRILGFDTFYSNNISDTEISERSLKEGRIILTRDLGILKRKIVTHGYYIRSRNPKEQLKEVINRFNLINLIKPFSLCTRCNELLIPIEKEKVSGKVPIFVYENYNNFNFCPKCKRIYWRGSHWENIRKLFNNILPPDIKK